VFQNPELFRTQVSLSPKQSTLDGVTHLGLVPAGVNINISNPLHSSLQVFKLVIAIQISKFYFKLLRNNFKIMIINVFWKKSVY
jgi:hypothetical protein